MGQLKVAEYVHLNVDDFESEEAKALAIQANAVAKQIAELHGMVADIYAIFEQLKPLMGAMPAMPPKMPAGLMPPFPFGR